MKWEPSLENERKEAVRAATELYYSYDTVKKIKSAQTVCEIGNILKQARLDGDYIFNF